MYPVGIRRLTANFPDCADRFVVTPSGSGKVMRIKNSGRVELRPCRRRGQLPDDAVAVPGNATIVTGVPADRATEVIKK